MFFATEVDPDPAKVNSLRGGSEAMAEAGRPLRLRQSS
jgi:hypothetical protein